MLAPAPRRRFRSVRPVCLSCEREGWTRSSRGATSKSPIRSHVKLRAGAAVFCVVVAESREEDEHLYFVRACYGISPAELFNDAGAAHR
jgi:hypothetical protein